MNLLMNFLFTSLSNDHDLMHVGKIFATKSEQVDTVIYVDQ